MRALWIVRPELESRRGGDSVQILETRRELEIRGVHVRLTSDPRPSFIGYDIVHLWHLDRLWENLPHVHRIKKEGRLAVLSTIWWPSDEFDCKGRKGLQGLISRQFPGTHYQSIRLLQRGLLARVRERRPAALRFNFVAAVGEVFDSLAALFPNSHAEAQALRETFGSVPPIVVVPNAVTSLNDAHSLSKKEDRRGVLCVGRIEPRKNQLALIRALRGTGLPLILVGEVGRFSRKYALRCQKVTGLEVCFVGAASHEQVYQYMRQAKVHVCPSWYETPGLVNLEAAMCGCVLVATPGGSTREYLRNDAFYVDPARPELMASVIQEAMNSKPSKALQARITQYYTWSAAAERTIQAYQMVMDGKPNIATAFMDTLVPA